MKKVLASIIICAFTTSINYAQLKVVSNDRVGIGNDSFFSGTGNKGLHIKKGGKSSLLFGDPNAGYGGIVQTSWDRHRMFIGANLLDDEINGWKNFQSGKGAAGISFVADEMGYGTNIAFLASQDGSYTARMKILGNGNVGIGMNPSYTLDVNGYIRTSEVLIESDVRLKENIKNLDCSGKLKELRPVQYNFNDSIFRFWKTEHNDSIDNEVLTEEQIRFKNKRQFGFLAQEVQQIFPELVDEDGNGILSIDYISMIPMLVAELKEQETRYEELNEKYDTLLQKVNSIQKQSAQ